MNTILHTFMPSIRGIRVFLILTATS